MIRIGTRGSALALAQTRLVADRLGEGVTIEVIRTAGDLSDRPIGELGDGAFVGAIEDALRAGAIDVAVHSLKDLPTEGSPELVIAAVLEREDARDVLVTRDRRGLGGLPRDVVVGTSSPRRAAFLRAVRPDVLTREIRGNVDTRLRKVHDGTYDAVVLAAAGLRRLGVAFDENEALPLELFPPAPGQGALAVQARAADRSILSRLASLDDADVHAATRAERATLRALGASCELPLGVYARAHHADIELDAALVTAEGIRRVQMRGRDPEELGRLAANALVEGVRV